LRCLKMMAGLNIYVIWKADDWAWYGRANWRSDGWPDLFDFFPLEQTVLLIGLLMYYRQSGAGSRGKPLKVLTPKDWYQNGHDVRGWKRGCHLDYPIFRAGSYLWQPAPAAAKFAIEELRQAWLKRQDSMHVFVCPCLFTTQWRKQL
jgi:hypothetical protein